MVKRATIKNMDRLGIVANSTLNLTPKTKKGSHCGAHKVVKVGQLPS